MNLDKYEITATRFLTDFIKYAWQNCIAIILIVSIIMIMYNPLFFSYKMISPVDVSAWLNPYEFQMIVTRFGVVVLKNCLIIGLPIILLNALAFLKRKEIPSPSLKSTSCALVAVVLFLITIYGIAYRNKEYNFVSKFYRQSSQTTNEDLYHYICDPEQTAEQQLLALLLLAHRNDDETIRKIKDHCMDALNIENNEVVFKYIERCSDKVSIHDQKTSLRFWTESRLKEGIFLSSYWSFKQFVHWAVNNNNQL